MMLNTKTSLTQVDFNHLLNDKTFIRHLLSNKTYRVDIAQPTYLYALDGDLLIMDNYTEIKLLHKEGILLKKGVYTFSNDSLTEKSIRVFSFILDNSFDNSAFIHSLWGADDHLKKEESISFPWFRCRYNLLQDAFINSVMPLLERSITKLYQQKLLKLHFVTFCNSYSASSSGYYFRHFIKHLYHAQYTHDMT